MAITDAELRAAENRAAATKAAYPAVESVRYDRRTARVVLALASGLELGFSPKQVQGLERARPDDLAEAEITPSGLGIHFPRLDADIYVPALLEGFLGSARWMAAQMGQKGGRVSSAAKAAAARKNGALGGRPKKHNVA